MGRAQVLTDHGILTIRPHIDEYTSVFKLFIREYQWELLFFKSYWMTQEDNNHVHIIYELRYEHEGKRRDRFEDKIRSVFDQFKLRNPKVAIDISVGIKEEDSYLKAVGYVKKNIIKNLPIEFWKSFNFSEEQDRESTRLSKENTVTYLITEINLPKLREKAYTWFLAHASAYGCMESDIQEFKTECLKQKVIWNISDVSFNYNMSLVWQMALLNTPEQAETLVPVSNVSFVSSPPNREEAYIDDKALAEAAELRTFVKNNRSNSALKAATGCSGIIKPKKQPSKQPS